MQKILDNINEAVKDGLKNKFNRHDSIIEFSFDELITTIKANEIHYNEESIKKVFTEIMKLKISQATDSVYINRHNILKVLGE